MTQDEFSKDDEIKKSTINDENAVFDKDLQG